MQEKTNTNPRIGSRSIKRCPTCMSADIYYVKSRQMYTCTRNKIQCEHFKTPKITFTLLPKKTRRHPANLKIISYEQFQRTLLLHNKLTTRERAFIATLYLTGKRISEIVQELTTDDVNLETIQGKEFLVFTNVKVLKRRKPFRDNVHVITEPYQPLVELILAHKRTVKEGEPLFNFGRCYGYLMVRKLGPEYFPHFLRHLRITHFARDGWRMPTIQKFIGWGSMYMAGHYIHLSKQDVIDQQLKEE